MDSSAPVVIVRASEIAARQVAGELLLFPLARSPEQLNCIYTFEGLGGFVWQQLAAPRTIDELVDAVIETYDVSQEVAARDVGLFVEDLRQARLVRHMEHAER